MSKKNIKITLALILVLCLKVSLLSADKVVNKVVAMVGNETILASELNEVAKPIIDQYQKANPDLLKNDGITKLKKSILDQMVDEKVLLQEAKRQKLTVSKRKQDLAWEDIKKRFKTEADFKPLFYVFPCTLR